MIRELADPAAQLLPHYTGRFHGYSNSARLARVEASGITASVERDTLQLPFRRPHPPGQVASRRQNGVNRSAASGCE